ncbi:DUF4421 family protein [Flavobacterium cerinum]|uniref:DUF4421 family protein n=1 Tax=Flavobacterium cerinum TaxID=2502784 RepID=UPI0013E33E4C|nr:DUF4421 family protein [Flavobacterium cerinum]
MAIIKKISFLLLFGGSCFAQTDSISNLYHKKYDDKISVQVFALNTSNSFTIQYAKEKLDVEMLPNLKTTFNLGVQYDIIAFSFGFASEILAENKDNKGAKMRTFSFTALPGRWMQRVDYYYQKGITLKSPENSVYFQRLKTLKLGGNTSYFFNKRFSYAATSFQNAKQLKSAGTFAAMLSYYYTEINGENEPDIGENSYFFNVALSPTYYYNWVIGKNFLVSGGFSFGAGATVNTSEHKSSTIAMVQASSLVSLGYNSDRFYGGINNKILVSSHEETSNVTIDDTMNYSTIFVGYRFDAPSFLEREKQRIKKHF